MDVPYFPRRLERSVPESALGGRMGEQRQERQRESFSDAQVLQTLPDFGVTVILGEPGAGKSTLARRWAATLAAQRSHHNWGDTEPPVPLLAQCKYFDAQTEFPWAIVHKAAEPSIPAEVRQAAKGGLLKYALILDALDELPFGHRRNLAQGLTSVHAPVIITCRAQVWQDSLARTFRESGLNIGEPYTIAPLSSDEQLDFLRRWPERPSDDWAEDLHQRVQRHPQLCGLAGNALLLTLVARLARERGLELPVTRARFYELAISNLWRRKTSLSDEQLDRLVPHRDRYLPALAYHVAETAGPTSPITPEHLERVAAELQLSPEIWPALNGVLLSSGLLRRDGSHDEPTYDFLHQTFREYALAQAYLQPGDRQNLNRRLVDLTRRCWCRSDDHQMLALAFAIAAQKGESLFAPVQELITLSETLPREERWVIGVSPLREALHLLHDSGVEVERQVLECLLKRVTSSRSRKIAVAAYDLTPPTVLASLAIDVDELVRRQVARNSKLPLVLASLATDSNEEVRDEVVRNRFTPPAILAANPEEWVRIEVASDMSTPPSVLASLYTDRKADVRHRVAANSSTAPTVLASLSTDRDGWVRQAVASNSATPPAVLINLVTDPDERVRREVAGNSSMPAAVLDSLVINSDVALRQGVAENSSTSPAVLASLSTDPSERVRQAVASNSATPPAVLGNLSTDPDEWVRIQVANHRLTPSAALAILATDLNEEVRCAVADNASTPPDVLASLAADPDSAAQQNAFWNISTPLAVLAAASYGWMRGGIAEKRSTPPDVLASLAADPDEEVRRGVATNSSTPPAVLAILATDPNEEVRKRVATNSSTPPAVLAILATDPNEEVRKRVATNSSTPPAVLAILATDSDEEVRRGVAGNGATTSPVFASLSTDPAEWVRREVARNSATPPAVLAILATDPDEWVRREVAWNKSTSPAVLASLTTDQSFQLSAARNVSCHLEDL